MCYANDIYAYHLRKSVPFRLNSNQRATPYRLHNKYVRNGDVIWRASRTHPGKCVWELGAGIRWLTPYFRKSFLHFLFSCWKSIFTCTQKILLISVAAVCSPQWISIYFQLILEDTNWFCVFRTEITESQSRLWIIFHISIGNLNNYMKIVFYLVFIKRQRFLKYVELKYRFRIHLDLQLAAQPHRTVNEHLYFCVTDGV